MEAIGKLLEHLGYAAPLLYAAAAYGFFYWLDENLSDAAKAALASTMKLKRYGKEQVASALVEVFYRIYTHRLLSWQAFYRSMNFTNAVFAIFIFESLLLKPIPGVAGFLGVGGYRFLMAALLFNIFTDYLSLFVIRLLLIRSGTKPVIGLVLAGLSGAAIVLLATLLRGLMIFTITRKTFLADWSLAFMWPAIIVFVWLPLLALGILVIRALTPLSWIVEKAQWALKEGDQHPLKAIGYVAAVVVFAVTVGLRGSSQPKPVDQCRGRPGRRTAFPAFGE
jgi:hypothetical protein